MNREIHRHCWYQRSTSGAIRVANVVKSGLKKGNWVREEQRELRLEQEKERQWIGLSCSVGSPRDPFYIRPRFSPYLVSVVAAVEVPRYRYFSFAIFRTWFEQWIENWTIVLCGTLCSEKSDSLFTPILDV